MKTALTIGLVLALAGLLVASFGAIQVGGGGLASSMAAEATASATPALTSTPAPAPVFALINMPDKSVLSMRAGPGLDYRRVGGVEANMVNLPLTGRIKGTTPRVWYELRRSGGGTGWITSFYVAEYVAPDVFCQDDRPKALITNFAKAVNDSDGQLVASLVSPMHGVTLRLWRDQLALNYLRYAPYLFSSDYPVNWGPPPGGVKGEVGSLRDAIYPRLKDVFGADYELYCNDASKVSTAFQPWRSEYKNINFYTVYKPESQDGKRDWRAWLLGVDYVDGNPYLFSLTNFQLEP
jgi:hypothetical protein